MPAPVSLFVFNRPAPTAAVLDALRRNAAASQTDLFVFSDCARHSGDAAAVQAVRQLIRNVPGFRRVIVKERATNFGLSRSIISGVSEVCGQYGRTIVLEDDLQPSPHFLQYMNDALELYASDERVASVHGYTYPVPEALPTTFFLRGGDCWGWGTWRRAWALFQSDGARLLEAIESRGLSHELDLDGSYGYTRMLRDQIAAKNDSWAIRWHASLFLEDRLTLYPGSSQVQNIGVDGSGIHVGRTKVFEHKRWGEPVEVKRIPLQESVSARRTFGRFLRSLRPSLPARVLASIKHLAAKAPARA